MHGNQVTELLLGSSKIFLFLTRALGWLKLFPLIMWYNSFFDSTNVFAVLKTLYISAVIIFVLPILMIPKLSIVK